MNTHGRDGLSSLVPLLLYLLRDLQKKRQHMFNADRSGFYRIRVHSQIPPANFSMRYKITV